MNSDAPSGPGDLNRSEAADSIVPLLWPESVALIGASADSSRIAGKPLHNLRLHGFPGRIYTVNPKYKDMNGVPCFPRVDDLPEGVDCAIVLLAADRVIPVLKALSLRKAKSAIVVSGGFAEGGREGRILQDEMSAIADRSGMRILGPNTLGAVNFHGRAVLSFSTSFEDGNLSAGPVGFISQSGALLSSLSDRASDYGMGLSHAVATGNEADLDVSEFLEFLARDEHTRVVMGLVESVRDGRKFLLALENLRRAGKPVVLLKVGKSEAGQKAALAHTGALAGSSRVFDAACRRAGVLQADDLEELLQTAHLMSRAKLPKGRTVGVITTSGGAAAMLADTATRHGLSLPSPSPAAASRLRDSLPSFAQQSLNPVDLTAQHLSQPEVYRQTVMEFLNDDAFGSVAVIMAPGSGKSGEERAETLVELDREARKPLVACWIGGGQSSRGRDTCRRNGLPTMEFPNHAATALARLADYAETRARFSPDDRPPEHVPLEPVEPLPGSTAPALTEYQSERWLAACGIPVLDGELAQSAGGALEAAERLGYPVVMKGMMPGILHKNIAGLVRLGIDNAESVLDSYQELTAALAAFAQAAGEDILIEPMAPSGVDLLIGAHIDPTFGPVVVFGWGGVHAEILDETSLRLAPISSTDAAEMLAEVRGFPAMAEDALGDGVEWNALKNVLVRISHIAAGMQDEMESIDLNPIRVIHRNGECRVLDASVVLKDRGSAA